MLERKREYTVHHLESSIDNKWYVNVGKSLSYTYTGHNAVLGVEQRVQDLQAAGYKQAA